MRPDHGQNRGRRDRCVHGVAAASQDFGTRLRSQWMSGHDGGRGTSDGGATLLGRWLLGCERLTWCRDEADRDEEDTPDQQVEGSITNSPRQHC